MAHGHSRFEAILLVALRAMALTFVGAPSGCSFIVPIDDLFCESGSDQGCADGDGGGVDRPYGEDGGTSASDAPSAEGRRDTALSGLRVLYASTDPSPSTTRIRAEFRIVNGSSIPVPLEEVSLHYYYTVEQRGQSQAMSCTFVSGAIPPYDCQNVRGTFTALPAAHPRANYRMEVTFTAAAGILKPFGGCRSSHWVMISRG
jgi:hypothetical protein